MKIESEMPDIDTEIPQNAVKVIGGDTVDDFPVLKAFQQYIDAEQSKARKRMVLLCLFFGILMTIVIVVFLLLLSGINSQNQRLNDRLVEYVMKDRDRQAAVVVQPPQDNTAILSRISEIQRKLEEATAKIAADKDESERKAAEADKADSVAKTAAATAQELEIERLKALLSAERQKKAEERDRKHQEELEAYRRKHYPEFYGLPAAAKQRQQKIQEISEEPIDSIETEPDIDRVLKDLEDDEAIEYFSEEPSSSVPAKRITQKKKPAKPTYSIPVEVNGTSGSWRIPE